MSKPWHQVDGYAFNWPALTSPIANERMKSLADAMMEKTPAERVEFLDKWIPALADDKAARKSGISAFDQHLVITALRTWREDNRDRARAAA